MIKQLLKKIGIIIGILVAPLAMAQYNDSAAKHFEGIRRAATQDVQKLITSTFTKVYGERNIPIAPVKELEEAIRAAFNALYVDFCTEKKHHVTYYADAKYLWERAEAQVNVMETKLEDMLGSWRRGEAMASSNVIVMAPVQEAVRTICDAVPQILEAALKQARHITGLVPYEKEWRVDPAVYQAHLARYQQIIADQDKALQDPRGQYESGTDYMDRLNGIQKKKEQAQIYAARFTNWRKSDHFKERPNRWFSHSVWSPYYLLADNQPFGRLTLEQEEPQAAPSFLAWRNCIQSCTSRLSDALDFTLINKAK